MQEYKNKRIARWATCNSQRINNLQMLLFAIPTGGIRRFQHSARPQQDHEQGAGLKAMNSMRRDWDERARKDAFLYIASWRDNWNEENFFASGEADYRGLVEPVVARLGFTPGERAMAELGCGAGRMTHACAR